MDFGAAAIQQMENVLASTKDQSVALLAMAPQIAELLALYNALGLEVPPSLRSIADEALKAGASLKPPEGVEDLLISIRDVLLDIAIALGAVDAAARGAGSSLADMGGPSTFTPGGVEGFKHGGFIPETFPAGRLVRVAEPGTGGEDLIPRNSSGGGGGGVTVINEFHGGVFFADEFQFDEEVARKTKLAFEENTLGIQESVQR